VREALTIQGCVVEVLATEESLGRHPGIATTARDGGIEIVPCDDRAIASLSGSVNPQGLVAVCRFVDVPLQEALAPGAQLIVVAGHVRDPGNAGTLVRCADAAGADAVVFAGSSVDPYNDKAVRASVGSLFHLPVVVGTPVPEAIAALKQAGFLVLAADVGGSSTLDQILDDGRLAGRVAWLFGNEAWGLSAGELTLVDDVVVVPIYGRAESLNVATAAAVCLYTTKRAQRGPATQEG